MAETYIEPGNIVGYTKVALKGNDYTMVGMGFEGCGTGQKVKITDLAGDFYGDLSDAEAMVFDQLMIWDRDAGYRNYYYSDNTGYAPYDKIWLDEGFMPVGDIDAIKSGEAFWFKRNLGPTPLTISGQVATNDVKITLVGTGYTMVGNPFPVEIKVSDLIGDFYGDLSDAEAMVFDQLMIWDRDAGYRNYYFSDNTGYAPYDKIWLDEGFMPVGDADTIKPGEAFLFKRNIGSTTLTLPAPVIN